MFDNESDKSYETSKAKVSELVFTLSNVNSALFS